MPDLFLDAYSANVALISPQSRIELAQMWGKGLLASVGGLRFVVLVKGINTGPSAEHYGHERGLATRSLGSAMVVWSTPRDSVYTPDTLLNLRRRG